MSVAAKPAIRSGAPEPRSVQISANRPAIRIGELGRRVGASPATIRAWERRYRVVSPERTPAGYRLYSAADEARLRELIRLRASGYATSEAARLAREIPHLAGQAGSGTAKAGNAEPSQAGARVAGRIAPSEADAGASAPASLRSPASSEWADELRRAIESFDETAAHASLDGAIADLPLETAVEDVILRLLRDLGTAWTDGDVTTAQEHFASNLIRGRLLTLARGWGAGTGPLAVLACPSGERHDLALIAFGLLMRERGWRIVFFGQDTPVFTIVETAKTLAPDAVVVAGVDARRMRSAEQDLTRLAGEWPVYLAGAGATRRLAERTGAELLEGEPSYAAARLSSTRPSS